MHPAIRADQALRELALSEARNTLGANEPLPVFLQNECLTQQEYSQIAANPEYQRLLKDFKAELAEKGFSFAAKARVLAEDLLADIYHMAKDKDTPAVMRVKTLEHLVEWGRLAPKTTAEVSNGPGYSITINLNSSPGARAGAPDADVVDVSPKTFSLTVPGAPRPPSAPSDDAESASLPVTHPLLAVFPPDSGDYYDAEAAYAP